MWANQSGKRKECSGCANNNMGIVAVGDVETLLPALSKSHMPDFPNTSLSQIYKVQFPQSMHFSFRRDPSYPARFVGLFPNLASKRGTVFPVKVRAHIQMSACKYANDAQAHTRSVYGMWLCKYVYARWKPKFGTRPNSLNDVVVCPECAQTPCR